ncbi:MAG: amidohydrolase [Rubrivivax sp.]|nr:amidohydrolase [Rubrivivax sp.]MCL4698907.1 amidohydrolase family protein [Burkholderiaceae bacterium]
MAGAVRDEPLIDVHTHVVPEDFPPYLGRVAGAPWPSMAPAHACHRHVMVFGKVYRTVSHQCWSCRVRLADMAGQGVSQQVLSPMPELLGPWLAPEDGRTLCRYLSDTIAGMVAEQPDRFIGLGAVPLQDVAMAIDELDRLRHVSGLRGVELPSHINGRPLGDPQLRPFFEAAAAWQAAIFVHPLRPVDLNRLVGPPALEQVLAFPGEIGLAGASLVTSGLLASVPGLRIALSHGGGTLAMLLPRLSHARGCVPPVRELLPQDPLADVRRLWVDDLVYDAPTLRHLVATFGADRVMAGSDYPFTIMDGDPAGSIAAAGFDDATRRALRAGNARRWLDGEVP